MGQAKKDFDQLLRLQAEIEEFLRESMGETRAKVKGEQSHIPHVDVYETGDFLDIIVDLPGIRKEDLNLYISTDHIFVDARKIPSRPEKTAHYYCIERYFGRFQREIEIPVIVNTREVDAKLENGTLHIRLVKINDRREKRRKIEVK